MGFFPHLDKAPEEGREMPRKKGVARLWELLGRDFLSFFKAGFLALAGAVPFIVGVIFSLTSHVLLFAPLAGLIGGLAAGPQLCGLADTILRALRDEPGFWWHRYKRAWRRNARASLLPGALGGALLSTQIFLLFHAGALGISLATGAALIAGFLLVLGLSVYVWPLLALMELPLSLLIKDAALLFLGRLPRSLAALAIEGAYWGVVIWFFPLAVSLLPLTNLWLPTVPALLLVYPGIESSFHIEEQLQKLEAEERDTER